MGGGGVRPLRCISAWHLRKEKVEAVWVPDRVSASHCGDLKERALLYLFILPTNEYLLWARDGTQGWEY